MARPINPYASPTQAPSARRLFESPVNPGRWRVRIATLIGGLAPLTAFFVFLGRGVQQESWLGEIGGFFVFEAVVRAVGIGIWFIAGWFFVYPAVLVVSRFVRLFVARHAAPQLWRKATDEALWTLPYIATLGAAAWLVYSLERLGGWPGDVIIGAVFHALAAWFCITLIVYWFRAARISGMGQFRSVDTQ